MKHELLFFGGLTAFACIAFTSQPETNAVPGEAKAEYVVTPRQPAVQTASDDGDELVLQRGNQGQFHLTAQVDGQDAEFLVDTGADMVALTVAEAERLGFSVDRESFRPLTQTASGTGYGTVVRIGTIEVAGQDFHDVQAVVIDGLPVNLLGQDVLGRLGSVSLEGDRMVLRR